MIQILLAAVLTAIRDHTKINPALMDDIYVGTVLQASGGATVSRMAALYAGLSEKISIYTTNQQCSSDLQAAVNIAVHNQEGLIDIAIGTGVESMTMGYGPTTMALMTSEKVPTANQAAVGCTLPMGEIIPVKTTLLEAEGQPKEIIVARDDGVRDGVTEESLRNSNQLLED
ncbi:3-ketoacyl-CoA thiolase with broad chain length specificity [Linnemannia zychae]|nr:3-ketoacyl-CoA thiolase with broad chain length specificity [Linnemannia zychae]